MQDKTTQTITSFMSGNGRSAQDEWRKSSNTDFIKTEAARLPSKEGAIKTEQTPISFANFKAGRNKPSFDALVAWCRNDPAFAAAFCLHIGIILPGEVEKTEALMRMVIAYGRGE